ncbi:hypothetical protein QYS49_04870 [Marivirga salinae]|uniref:Uncharacterized protein n=1 Tax=Marivirga salinarum TaxID=3059078 RepID=A0AA49GAY7_9BACT|nr:hypothetical protein [Marivirga sp. BDSF4-3]WKK76628.2 hypothetical protein QYS49_04870 [Marivirga sp. BDSF4-3]
MKQSIALLISIYLLVSCTEREIQQIDFSTDYKFSSEIEEQILTDTIPWKYQISAADFAKKGDYKNALIHWDMGMPTQDRNYTKSEIDSINSKYSVVNATEYIIQEAQKNQVVMINEAHHNSMHRAFTKSLLQRLFDNGYKNLGLEALDIGNNLDSALNRRGYPVQKTGYYTQDPQFGDLIRDAIEIGYEVFAYERLGTDFGKNREIGQAKNIQKVIESKPNEKFLIHCGFAHLMEGNYSGWEKAMAGRLTEYTGINPLTINQVEYSERSKAEYNHPLLKALDIKESSVLIDKDDNPLKYEKDEAWADIAVLHPNTDYVDGRPNWLFENGNKNISLELKDIPIEFPVMVLAYKKGEDINMAVPMDITEIEDKKENAHLALEKGAYEIVVTNKLKSFKFERVVE